MCLHKAVCSHLSGEPGYVGAVWRRGKAKMHLPDEGDVFSRHLFKVTNGCGLSCKAVVGVVVCHDGGGTQLAQFVLWALQLHLHGLQLLVLAAVHWMWRTQLTTYRDWICHSHSHWDSLCCGQTLGNQANQWHWHISVYQIITERKMGSEDIQEPFIYTSYEETGLFMDYMEKVKWISLGEISEFTVLMFLFCSVQFNQIFQIQVQFEGAGV